MGLAHPPRLKMSLGGSTLRTLQSWSQVGEYQQLHPEIFVNGKISIVTIQGAYLVSYIRYLPLSWSCCKHFWADYSICKTEWRLITKPSTVPDFCSFSFKFKSYFGERQAFGNYRLNLLGDDSSKVNSKFGVWLESAPRLIDVWFLCVNHSRDTNRLIGCCKQVGVDSEQPA